MHLPEQTTPYTPGDKRDTEAKGNTPTSVLPPGPARDELDTLPYQVTPSKHPANPPAAVPLTFGRYRVLEQRGRGGFGIVYAALDEQLRRKVAIKVSHRSFTQVEAEQPLAEARRLAQFRHPGIVTVFDVGIQDGHCYIVSDFIEGGSLDDWLKQEQPAWPESVRIVAELADALAHAHTALTIHRDVKPSNVMLTPDRRPILVDFGLALTDETAALERGQVLGTPLYMSPEQAAGAGHRIDGRTDIYSLGVILYRMLTGRQPFRSTDIDELLRQVIEDEPQPPRQLAPHLPSELEQICMKALAKRIADRYTTAADFAADLRRLLRPTELPPAPVAIQAPPAPPAPALESERRQVTILLAGLDWSADAEADPEEQHQRLQAFRAIWAEVVQRYEGHVLPMAGPAFLACFGYPVALEDAARRAIRVALEALGATGGQATTAWTTIHTGLAIVGGAGKTGTDLVAGEAMAIASRLEALAQPGTVLVTEGTQRLAREFFVYEPAGRHTLRGSARPVELFRVVRATDVASRLEGAALADVTPLVGRDQEVGLLLDRWEQAQEGRGQVVQLTGEPGIGKSRLVHVLKERIGDTQARGRAIVEWRCTPLHRSSSLYPVVECFERLLRFGREDTAADRLDRLTAHLAPLGLDGPSFLPLFASLLSVPLDGRCPPLELSPQRQKERTSEALLLWLRRQADQQPLLFVVEDLHWIDASTQEFLSGLLEEVPSVPVLVVLTYRPEYAPPWSGQAQRTQIALTRLTRRQVAALMARKAGVDNVPTALVDQVAARTDGVPLFVEEFTQMLVEAGRFRGEADAGGLSGLFGTGAIPATLQDLLLARLDRITRRRDVVQLAATLGREFSYELLQAVSATDETTLRDELAKLVNAEILYPKGRPPHGRYLFKHALLQDAAYQSLLRTRRQEFHRRVGQVLEERFPDTVETQPEVVAQHYTEAGLLQKGVDYWEKAGLRAQSRHAHTEAIAHFNRGLELLARVDEAPERDGQELRLQLALSLSLMAARGYAAPEVGPVQGRARALCKKIGPQAPLFYVLWGTWAWRFIRSDLDACLDLANEIVPLAEALGDRALRAEAHFAPACTLFYRGDFAGSRQHGDAGFALWDREASVAQMRLIGQNCGVGLLCYRAIPAWYLGYPDQALRHAAEARQLARELAHPMTTALGTYNISFVEQLCGLAAETEADAAAEIALCTEQGFPFWRGMGLLSRGAALLLQGNAVSAIDVLRQGIQAVEATGAEITLAHYWNCLAEACWRAGQRGAALAALEQGFTHMNQTAAFFAEAEGQRLKGEILAGDADWQTEAESCLRQALEVSRRQGARSLELRAALSLCRFLTGRGRPAEGHELLAGVYAWFTEGFETRDLLEARQLLAVDAPPSGTKP